MKLFSTLILVIVVFTIISKADFYYLLASEADYQNQENQRRVAEIITLIEKNPAWKEIQKDDELKKDEILKLLQQISLFDVDLIREAIKQYTASLKGIDVTGWSRIFLLNRYIFYITPKKIDSERGFGGWAGVPHDNWSWPLETTSDRKVLIVGEFHGYYGPGYSALDEFDFFRKHFPLRKNTK